MGHRAPLHHGRDDERPRCPTPAPRAATPSPSTSPTRSPCECERGPRGAPSWPSAAAAAARFRSGREARPAAAGRRGVRVLDHELRAFQAFLVVDLGADQVLVAHRVDQQRHAVLHHRGVVFVGDLVEREAVLEAGAAAARHEHAQLESGLPSSSISALTLAAAASVKTSGAGISFIAFIVVLPSGAVRA